MGGMFSDDWNDNNIEISSIDCLAFHKHPGQLSYFRHRSLAGTKSPPAKFN